MRGASEPAARAAAAAGDPVVALGTAGHVLDFDDTYLPGIAHLSAPVAPAALVLGAHENATVGDVLAAYADGFEAMGALAAAGHPALYDRGWHPTAVCGAVGAAVAAARLLGADRDTAAALAALRAGGLRAAFGSDGKSIQVGLAAATGVAAARLAAAGATVPDDRIAAAWRDAYGGDWDTSAQRAPSTRTGSRRGRAACRPTGRSSARSASTAYPTGRSPCSPTRCRARPPATTASRRRCRPSSRSPTRPRSPSCAAARASTTSPRSTPRSSSLAERIEIRTDTALGESEFALLAGDEELARVDAARGSPLHPLSAEDLRAKVHDLAGDRFDDLADDTPAGELLTRL